MIVFVAYVVIAILCVVLGCVHDKIVTRGTTVGDFILYVILSVIPICNVVLLLICVHEICKETGVMKKRLF